MVPPSAIESAISLRSLEFRLAEVHKLCATRFRFQATLLVLLMEPLQQAISLCLRDGSINLLLGPCRDALEHDTVRRDCDTASVRRGRNVSASPGSVGKLGGGVALAPPRKRRTCRIFAKHKRGRFG